MTTAAGAGATNRDFVSMLIAAFEAAEDDKPVTLDYNLGVGLHRPVKLEAVLRHPDLSLGLLSQLGSNAAAVETLKRSLSYADDITGSISYTMKDDTAAVAQQMLNAFAVMLHTPHDHTYAAMLSWGSNVYHPADREHNGRLEFGLRYEDVKSNPEKRDGLVSTLSYTQKLTATTSLPVALTYANRASDLTDVNRKLSLHFGLSYKLQSK